MSQEQKCTQCSLENNNGVCNRKDCSNSKTEEVCNCSETSCKNNCVKNHTHKGFSCEKCKPEPKGWEERFDEIVSEWKEPEFRFERHEKLIDYTSDVIKKMRVLISHVEQEALERGRKDEKEKIIGLLGKESTLDGVARLINQLNGNE